MSISSESRPVHVNDLIRESFERQARPDELTPPEKMALLNLHRSPGSQKLYDEMLRKGTFHPRETDFHALVGRNLAYRPREMRWHRLNDQGRATVAVMLRQAYGETIEKYAGGYLVTPFVDAIEGHKFRESHCSGARVRGECTCGWYSDELKGPYTAKNLRTQFSRHIRTVQGIDGLKAALTLPEKT